MTNDGLKDATLAQLSEVANVAQFVSFSPGVSPTLRYRRIHDKPSGGHFINLRSAIAELFAAASSGKVCIRTFLPGGPKAQPFKYDISSLDEVVALTSKFALDGLYTIVNELIDIHDGGVAGVWHGNVVEFAPDATPRCVEGAGTAFLPANLAREFFQIVYGFKPEMDFGDSRVEFGLHPLRVGWRQTHTLVWEIDDQLPPPSYMRPISWPNRFSEFIGDKTYGLLIAHCIGLLVPQTLALGRGVAPFFFGTKTMNAEPWLRTSPKHKAPGKFPTIRGWRDPFKLLAALGADGDSIQTVLAQDGVDSKWSGALATQIDGKPIIEGVLGYGDGFMLGAKPAEQLPENISVDVLRVYDKAASTVGPCRMEWAHDGDRVWVLQLNLGRSPGSGDIIVEGSASNWLNYDVNQGLAGLPQKIAEASQGGNGINLIGDVGVTSHFAELLQRARIPSRLIR